MKLMSRSSLKHIIQYHSESLSDIRKLRNILRENSYLTEHLRDIESTYEDMVSDWERACALVGDEIMDGGIKFEQLDKECYEQLESIWLHDVKRTKAYLIGERLSGGDNDANYYTACMSIQRALLEGDRLSLDEFDRVKAYLGHRYLSNGKLDEQKSNDLIGKKACRIWKTTSNTNQMENWLSAKEYVKLYYENIIPAVEGQDEGAILNVINAFRMSEESGNRVLVTNFFEALIAINFLNSEKLRKVMLSNNINNPI